MDDEESLKRHKKEESRILRGAGTYQRAKESAIYFKPENREDVLEDIVFKKSSNGPNEILKVAIDLAAEILSLEQEYQYGIFSRIKKLEQTVKTLSNCQTNLDQKYQPVKDYFDATMDWTSHLPKNQPENIWVLIRNSQPELYFTTKEQGLQYITSLENNQNLILKRLNKGTV